VLKVGNASVLRKTWDADVFHNPKDILAAAGGGFLFCGYFNGGEGAELLKLSDSGALESAEKNDQPETFENLNALASVPSAGLLVAGSRSFAEETTWVPFGGSIGEAAISWQDASGT